MQIPVAFGRSGVVLKLPGGPRYEVLQAHSAAALSDVPAAIQRALDAPIGCAPLLELARGKRTAAISVCDITRPAPNPTTLPPLWRRCIAPGCARKILRCASPRDCIARQPTKSCGRSSRLRSPRAIRFSIMRDDKSRNPGLHS